MRRFAQNKPKEKPKLDPKSLPELNATPEQLKDLDPKKYDLIEKIKLEIVELGLGLLIFEGAVRGVNFTFLRNFKFTPAFITSGINYMLLDQMLKDLTEANDLLKKIDKNLFTKLSPYIAAMMFPYVQKDNPMGAAIGALFEGKDPYYAAEQKAAEIGAISNYEAIPDLITKIFDLAENALLIMMNFGVTIPPVIWISIAIIKRIFTTKNVKDYASQKGGFSSYQQMQDFKEAAKIPSTLYRVYELGLNSDRTEYVGLKLIGSNGEISPWLRPGEKWKGLQIIQISPSKVQREDITRIRTFERNIVVSKENKRYTLKFLMGNNPQNANDTPSGNLDIEQFGISNDYSKLIETLIKDYLFEKKLNPQKDFIRIEDFNDFVKNHKAKEIYKWIGNQYSPEFTTLQTYIGPAISLYNQSVKSKTNYHQPEAFITKAMVDEYIRKIPPGSVRAKKLKEVLEAYSKGTEESVNWTGWSALGKTAIIAYAKENYYKEDNRKFKEKYIYAPEKQLVPEKTPVRTKLSEVMQAIKEGKLSSVSWDKWSEIGKISIIEEAIDRLQNAGYGILNPGAPQGYVPPISNDILNQLNPKYRPYRTNRWVDPRVLR